MRPDSSATFVFIGDYSQDGTWPRPVAAPPSPGKPDWNRTSVSFSASRAKVTYGNGTRPARGRT
ncbi:MAG TPA: hypothetical protein VFB81_01095 [Myxococcales bacterium]|nr:hypothetical protein [Myxococcales bacterium]